MSFSQSIFRVTSAGDIKQKTKYHPSCDMRETQISGFLKKLQILNGYMQRISFLNLVSN
jgi:hypothetical protein